MKIIVVYESWRPHPLAWIHRAEAHAIAEELRREGHEARLAPYRDAMVFDLPPGPILLRLSDPVMLRAARTFTGAAVPFSGPSGPVMERCYDKYEAYRVASENGVDGPATALASDAAELRFPLILKPRRGSDSIGVRQVKSGPIPVRFRTDSFIAQQYVRGAELTVAVVSDQVGMPLRILLPEGTLYSFIRKYLLCPPRVPLNDTGLTARVRQMALKIAEVLSVDWAARIDLIHETTTDRLRFLECDVAPLVGAHSAFAASFEAAGINRAEQLRMLVNETAGRTHLRS